MTKRTTRKDGYIDAFITTRPSTNGGFVVGKLSDQELTQLYGNALARIIVTKKADEAVKNWIEIDGDQEDLVKQEMETLYVEEKITEALYWDRLYGMSAIFIVADDGKNADEPLDVEDLRKIIGLEVYDKRDIYMDTSTFNLTDDINNPNYGKPEWYQITPPNGGMSFYVHYSRLIIFDGETLPKRERIANNGAGLSCLDGMADSIRRFNAAEDKVVQILDRFSTALLKLDGLNDIVQTDEGTEVVIKRLNIIDTARTIMGTIAIDKDDEYQVFNVPLTGLKEVLQEFEQIVSALSGIPFTILWGRSPAGLNSTGDADLENYYNTVKGIQKRKIRPALEYLVKLIMLSKQGPTDGVELENWSVRFNELKQITEKEKAELEKIQTETKQAEFNLVIELIENQMLNYTDAKKYLAEKGELPVTTTDLDLDDDE